MIITKLIQFMTLAHSKVFKMMCICRKVFKLVNSSLRFLYLQCHRRRTTTENSNLFSLQKLIKMETDREEYTIQQQKYKHHPSKMGKKYNIFKEKENVFFDNIIKIQISNLVVRMTSFFCSIACF